MLYRIAIVVLILCSGVMAQEGLSIGQTVKPGEKLRYTITFKGDTKATSIMLRFYLQGGAKTSQKGLPENFELNQSFRTSPTTFDVGGTVGECASGLYRLQLILAQSNRSSRPYQYGIDFNDNITLSVDNNSEENLFPDIKYIKPAPPKPLQ